MLKLTIKNSFVGSIDNLEHCRRLALCRAFVVFFINAVSCCFQAAKEVVLSYYPKYESTAKEIHVRVAEMPLMEEIRSLRSEVISL